MPLIRIKRFSQVTLPPDIRKRFHLNEGDYLEAEAVDEGILLKPVTVVERKKAWDRLFEVLDTVKDSKPGSKKAAKASEQDIATMIKGYRKKSND